LDKLVRQLSFGVPVAKQYQHQGLSLSDLINEGNLGLIKAAQRFDETKGSSLFHTRCGGFASPSCRRWQSRELVRLPQNKIGTYNKANKGYMAFEQEQRESQVRKN